MTVKDVEDMIDITFNIILNQLRHLTPTKMENYPVKANNILLVAKIETDLLSTIIFHCNCEDEYKKFDYFERCLELSRCFDLMRHEIGEKK